MNDLELVKKIAARLYDRKALDITALKVAHLTVLCDYMIIATGRTANQVSSLAGDVEELLAEEGIVMRRSEGAAEGRWAVLDYGHILVHIFHRDERSFYNLDRLWSDGQNQVDLGLDQSAD